MAASAPAAVCFAHGAQRIGAVLSSRARDSQSRRILPLRGVRQGLSLASSHPIDSTAHNLLGGHDIDRRGSLHLRRRGRFEKPSAAVDFESIDLCADVERGQPLSFVFEATQMASRNSIRLHSGASLLCHCSYRHGDKWGRLSCVNASLYPARCNHNSARRCWISPGWVLYCQLAWAGKIP